MKEILIVNYNATTTGGTTTVIGHLAELLQGSYQVHILSLMGTERFPWALPEKTAFHTILPGRVRLRETFFRATPYLRRYIREHSICAILLMGDWSSIPVLLGTLGTGCPVIACDHGGLSDPEREWFTRAEGWLRFHRCREAVVLTRRSEELLRKLYPGCRCPVSIIHNSIVPFPEAPPLRESPRELVTLSRLTWKKGLREMVETALLLREKKPDYIWHVYGDGENREWMEDAIRKNALEPNLILMGETKDAPAAYRRGAVMVLTSHHEGLPMVLLEAKAAGLPTVAFDVPTGPAEVIREDVDGLLLTPGDCAGMAEQLLRLLTEEALYRRMAENARGNLEEFSPERVKADWCALLERVTK